MLHNIPSWIIEIVDSYNCPQCDNPMASKGIMAIGLRESHKDNGMVVLFIIHKCSFCDSQLSLEIQPCELGDFIDIMVEVEEEDRSPKPDIDMMDAIEAVGETEDNDDIKPIEEDSAKPMDIVKPGHKRKRIFRNGNHQGKSKISNKEIDDFKIQLQSISNKNDLLKNFGVIVKEKIKDKNNGSKDK